MRKKILYIWDILMIIVLAACSFPMQEEAQPSPTRSAETPTPEIAENIFDQGTFSLSLPTGWSVSGPMMVDSAPNGTFMLYLLGENPAGADAPGTSRVVVAKASEWTPETFALSQCSTCPENPFESLTLGGMPASRTQVGGGGVPFMVTWYFVEHGDDLIALAIHDPETLEPLSEVVQSIQFK